MNPWLEAAAQAVGRPLDGIARQRLGVLGRWLAEEALFAGGLGPNEASLIDERHLADSILFGGGWSHPPVKCWDLGSGAGLPGLVLASIWPETRLVLIDSSERRCELARRGGRVIGVAVEVLRARIEDLIGPYEAIVSRATIPAQRFRPVLERLLAPGGVAVISGSKDGPTEGYERLRFPTDESFDRNARLLMMRSP
ncbi:MAG: RsmG family class I SAM-dependent methyltransferase [Acidimicrobiia bacterium]